MSSNLIIEPPKPINISSNFFIIPYKVAAHRFEMNLAKFNKLVKEGFNPDNNPEVFKLYKETIQLKADVMKYTNHLLHFAMDDNEKQTATQLMERIKEVTSKEEYNDVNDEYIRLIRSVDSKANGIHFKKNALVDITIISAVVAAAIASLKLFKKLRARSDTPKPNKGRSVISHLKHQ